MTDLAKELPVLGFERGRNALWYRQSPHSAGGHSDLVMSAYPNPNSKEWHLTVYVPREKVLPILRILYDETNTGEGEQSHE